MESAGTTGYSWEQTKALAAVHEAGREIAASLDLERTLRLVMQKAAETLPMDVGVLFVRNEALQRYLVAVSHNIPPEQVDSITFAFNEGVPWMGGTASSAAHLLKMPASIRGCIRSGNKPRCWKHCRLACCACSSCRAQSCLTLPKHQGPLCS